LLQFDQNAVGARGMDERDPGALGAWTRLFVDQPDATCLQLRERGGNVVNPQRDVVQPGAALLDVLRDGRVGRGGLEKFQAGLAHRQKVSPHLLRGDLFRRLDDESQCVAVESKGGLNVLNGDADMIEYRFHFIDKDYSCSS
jgi:hypothetical protein